MGMIRTQRRQPDLGLADVQDSPYRLTKTAGEIWPLFSVVRGSRDADDMPDLARLDHRGKRRCLRAPSTKRGLSRHPSAEIPGSQAIDLHRRSVPDGVEFVTVMWFDSVKSLQRFAGPNYEVAVVPPEARELLARFDPRSAPYTMIEGRSA